MEELTQTVHDYVPQDQDEMRVKEEIFRWIRLRGDALLSRESDVHFTASAFIFNYDMSRMLFVYHNIYGSFSLTGGHADGNADLLQTAMREAEEETGVKACPYVSKPVAIDILPVKEHIKNGKVVAQHRHICVTYAFIALGQQSLKIKEDENSAVEWLPVSHWKPYISEAHMVPVYEKCLLRIQTLQREKEDLFVRLKEILLPWYYKNRRDLPWRRDRDPYHIWVSEIMLQQTRVEAVKGYYARFIERLPTIRDLAEISERELMKLWEGLGYYNRVRNMQKAAKIVQTEYGGKFPSEYERIRKLPGIGAYTAGAIASIAFEQPYPAIDGNVFRIIGRITEDFRDPSCAEYIIDLTERLKRNYPKECRGDFTQALMELGATVCIPGGVPLCAECPMKELCFARKNATTGSLPSKKSKPQRNTEKYTVFILRSGSGYALRKREGKKVLTGMWEFPNVPNMLSEDEAGSWLRECGVNRAVLTDGPKIIRHIFTHLEWEMNCYYFECDGEAACFQWYTEEQIEREIALPTAFRKCLQT